MATRFSLKKPRLIQNKLGAVIEPIRHALCGRIVSRQEYSKPDVTPFFRANGYPPDRQDYKDLLGNNFIDWRLQVHGLLEEPLELSLPELHTMKKEIQITEHSCIQGWTAIGEWGGLSMNYPLTLILNILSKCSSVIASDGVSSHSMRFCPKSNQHICLVVI
ncbi:MAG TPA: hypothetical protein VEH06_15920 [Candidatus Bathyarchaeia archaeon]|nr:hypothetical protein [Candidatus Bathyarchaeia archaeon]